MSQAGLARIGSGNLPPAVPLQFTGNNGTISVPVANNENVVTANSTALIIGSGSTLTLDFGLTNLFLGSSGSSITTATSNSCYGQNAGNSINQAFQNCLFGPFCGSSLTNSINNSAFGYGSLNLFTNGAGNAGSNSAFGSGSLGNLLTGIANSCFGLGAGSSYSGSESSNICIRNTGVVSESNTIRIGTQGTGIGQQNICYLAGVLVTSSGRIRNITAPVSYPYIVLSTDDIISINTTSARTINLPNSPTSGTTYILKDITGSAGANNISVTTPGGTVTIDGSTTYTMNSNYASITVYFNGTNYFII